MIQTKDTKTKEQVIQRQSRKLHDLIRFKRTFTDPFIKQRANSYLNLGIVPIHGHARFVGPATLKVQNDGDGGDGKGKSVLEGKHILIATGSKPENLTIPGYENVITSDQFLEFGSDHLPDKIVFVDGGYISFEFAHISVRAGCKDVTILHRGKQHLEHFDQDLVKQLVQRSQEIGIYIRLQTEVKRIDFSDDGKLVVHSSSISNSQEGTIV